MLSCLHLFLACHQERVNVLEPFKLGLVNASYHFPGNREEEGRQSGGRGSREGGERSVEGDTAASLTVLTHNPQLFGVTLLANSLHFSLTSPPSISLSLLLSHLSLTGHQE